jgi:hypothetical protein
MRRRPVSVGTEGSASTDVVVISTGVVPSTAAVAGFDVGGVRLAGARFGRGLGVAVPGGFAGGLGAGSAVVLLRRVVMARASRAGLDPGPGQ